jgi:hypothetical protein
MSVVMESKIVGEFVQAWWTVKCGCSTVLDRGALNEARMALIREFGKGADSAIIEAMPLTT